MKNEMKKYTAETLSEKEMESITGGSDRSAADIGIGSSATLKWPKGPIIRTTRSGANLFF